MIHEATRTLVKSPPEVWEQCSDPDSLKRHLNGSFGDIRVTRLDPERAVDWEAEQVTGTVLIEPSAWGTRVTLTAEVEGEEPEPVPEVAAEEPEASSVEPVPLEPPRRKTFRDLWARFRREPPPEFEPEPKPELEPEPAASEVPVEATVPDKAPAEPEAPRLDAGAALAAALESLGQAHHRPFSRG